MTEQRGMFPLKVDRPEKSSMSLLKRIEFCPYSGGLYISERGGPRTHALIRGELIHEVIADATNYMIEQGEPEMPGEIVKDRAQALMEERPDLSLPAREQDAVRAMAWNWGEGTLLDLEHIVAVETMLELQIGSWLVRGRIDRAEIVNGQGWVRDYKSSLAVISQDEMDHDFQSTLYALLLAEGTVEGETVPLGKGIDTFGRVQEFLRYRGQEGTIIGRYAVSDRADLHDFKRTLESHLATLDHGIEEGEWLATPGSWCSTCPASSLCPIPADLRDVKTIGTEGDALEVAQRIRFTEKDLKADKAALKLYVDENGDLTDGDEVWSFTYSESEFASDKDAIKQALADAGHDPETFYSMRRSTRFGKRKIPA